MVNGSGRSENCLEIEAILDCRIEPWKVRYYKTRMKMKSWKTLTKCAYVFEVNLLKLPLRLEDKYFNLKWKLWIAADMHLNSILWKCQ